MDNESWCSMELRIEPRFRNKIPPLTKEEFEQLESNILNDGEVYEPIVVWNGAIVDGHNRWKIIQKHPDIPYRIKEMDFPDEWAAFEWMYAKQLGRRNLTEQQRTYMIGKMYEARKRSRGNPDRRGDDGRFHQLPQNEEIGTGGTANQIAKELGVARATVERSEKYAHGIDAISNVSQDAANAILTGQVKATKKSIRELGGAPTDLVQRVAQAIDDDEELPPIYDHASTECDVEEPEPYNITDLVNEIVENGGDLECRLRNHVRMRLSIVGGNKFKVQVADAINTIIDGLNIFKGEVLNGEFGNGQAL